MDTGVVKTIKIQSNDGEVYEADEKIIEQSSLIKALTECKNIVSRNGWVV